MRKYCIAFGSDCIEAARSCLANSCLERDFELLCSDNSQPKWRKNSIHLDSYPENIDTLRYRG